jgi:GNAT superfamily N-acetyltransferase
MSASRSSVTDAVRPRWHDDGLGDRRISFTIAGVRDPVTIRPMHTTDADLVASLHLASWRTAYRSILSDDYLANHAEAERRRHWTQRLETPRDHETGRIASLDGAPVGFFYLIAAADPDRGTLLDNLHVAPHARGAGLGRRLLDEAARVIAAQRWPGGLHLWVFEANAGARRFYERHGAVRVERIMYDAADGGRHPALCYAWADAAVLRRP